ncbi:MAG: acetyl/propionyl/methylcrotonyl-CoA carboxylase subunit alpha [Polymorphobacter sp.]|uniref:acetyl/propionyl/methylcrotonyl-CoA carboxylase subunit alpha n=1 Tax=Polymorphobacter sp. TaxID=1909290 RepID=UPI003A8C28FF
MKRLLIANRGEIARRIIRTAHAMGIETVALHADADAASPHVSEASEAVSLGPDSARPYLDAERILEIARQTGADAIHPGYGFLSENADFAALVTSAGLTFVGPPSAAIRAMALKDAAKALMKKAGVPVTPGYHGMDQSLARLQKAAEAIGYPLLIKAVAGGGGKGMRTVHGAAAFQDAVLAAQREGEASFGNAALLLEKLVGRARHVEVQVFADAHGNVVHLHERDCSLQRRHQKVIEEAPAPGLSDRLRHRLGVAAVTAATAIGYQNAGTVEFLLDLDDTDSDGDPKFYFMEMNTRLQVEHPVTEAITGLDLVEWQLRVARGEPLPLQQHEIPCTGHAVEARLYAEDVPSGFLPSTGTLTALRFPALLRIDTGVESGSRIGLDYDPMIAKLIAHAPTRDEALASLTAGLDATVARGLKSNRAFLARLAAAPAFIAGDFDTGFIARHLDTLTTTNPPSKDLVALAAAVLAAPPSLGTGPFAAPFRLNLPTQTSIRLWHGDTCHSHTVPADAPPPRQLADGRHRQGPLTAFIDVSEDHVEIRTDGDSYTLTRHAPRRHETGSSSGELTAPMPGRVLSLDVTEGDRVEAGQRLVILEAMKMEHQLKSPASGRITGLAVAAGDQVTEGTRLLTITPVDG